jgi:hypothetical protein
MSIDRRRSLQDAYIPARRWSVSGYEKFAFTVFERTFKEVGLPRVIRTDNGVPLASAHAVYGLSKMSAWWRRLGILIERIKPGHPQQNGRHDVVDQAIQRICSLDDSGSGGALPGNHPAMYSGLLNRCVRCRVGH